ncbi:MULTISPECIES: DNA polymerase IV [Parachlamydia]|jgi:nucleotidyltransferase/DNA polymerase involved in DNA repair|uniref:DNA polymerase IV n=1 Tax=Parachlamydia acanthamoebae (strain UV7) TaxID=765952 RepID=F8L068_PARAV|nr:DNA polymerase IV [Parachlamydia acanthamoebae]CCB86598.1 DNA polymerase IV [Parachlamydia acanthamoebae UV-7]
MNQRIIFHIDMDAFFASIEILRNPSLKGKPVIVGGSPDKRGVVSTCSYEARAYGVHSAMSLFEAKKKCPHAIFVEGDYAIYRNYSSKVMDILSRHSSLVEVVSIDEAYMDVSFLKDDPEMTAKQYGRKLKEAVLKNTGLTCSVGIASNKLIAKIASSRAKPNGLYEIPSGEEAAFLATLPIGAIPGIGSKTEKSLIDDRLYTIADLQKIDLDTLIERYGTRGYYFYLAAHGIDKRPVDGEEYFPKSIGAETTFEADLADSTILLETLSELVQKACKRLKKYQTRTRGFSLKLRYSDFRTVTRSRLLFSHTQDEQTIWEEARDFFLKVHTKDVPLRLIGISLEKLSDGYWQPTLWNWEQP